ncbi:hypothetical protein GF318_04110 [Candidatus Micrarchaeota archaeon]|nr:hypothetical protein [Candidatus Micrarchaeota archaeon]
MPKKASSSKKKRAAKKAGPKKRKMPSLPTVNEKNIDELEQEAISRVNKTLSALEVALASWDASDKLPEKKNKFMRYKWLHDALTEWERNLLKSVGKEEDFQTRLNRLQQFANIYHSYAGR